MTRYEQQTDFEDDCSSVGSSRTEDIPTGTTRARYQMGSHCWRSRTNLEKLLIIGWLILIGMVAILVAVIYSQASKAPNIRVHNHETVFGTCLKKECVMISGKILERMNVSVDPCTDFYQYACGGWLASPVKPEGKPTWGTLTKLALDNQMIIRRALESDSPNESKAEEKARVFYHSCIDINNTIEERGGKPLFELLEAAGGWALYGNWSDENYNLQEDIIRSQVEYNSGAFFSWGVAENDKNSNKYVLQFDQGGLMLPSRNYYLNKSEKAVADAYVQYITKVGVLLGASENMSRSVAEDIMAFETSLASFTKPDEQRRDDEKLYHNMTLEQLSKKAPFMDWTAFVNSAFNTINRSIGTNEEIVVYAPGYLETLANFLHNKSLTKNGNTSIHNYLTWHVVKNHIVFLSKEFREASSVLEKAQVGVSGLEEGWKECVGVSDSALGHAVGAMYVREAFSEDSRQMATNMLLGIRQAFLKNLNSVPWMDSKTKMAAIDKADHIYDIIGYPDYILNLTELDEKYQELEVTENMFFENNINVTLYKIKDNLNRLFKPVNKTKWDITPPTVNAYYSPTRNSIVLPAGILQPPLFDKHNPQALNYGAVGVVMGHELSHAFDDQGRKYDKHGNLDPWWGIATAQNFKQTTNCMVDQYSNYTLREEHLKGNLTLGENIADNGGLKSSFQAYKEWSKNRPPEIVLPGLRLSSAQLFFLGFAQVWCTTMTEEVAHLEIMKDSHVPPQFRVRGSLSNSKEFAEAYRCPVGSVMNPKDKCIVW